MPAAGQKCRCCTRADAQQAQLEAQHTAEQSNPQGGEQASPDFIPDSPEHPTDETTLDVLGLDFTAWEQVALSIFRPRASAVPAAMLNGHAEIHMTWHWVSGHDNQSRPGLPIIHHVHPTYRAARAAMAQHRPAEEQPVSPCTRFFENPRLGQMYGHNPRAVGGGSQGAGAGHINPPERPEPLQTPVDIRASVITIEDDDEPVEPSLKRTASVAFSQEEVAAPDVELPADWFDDDSDSSVVINMADIPEWRGEGESSKRRRLDRSANEEEEASP